MLGHYLKFPVIFFILRVKLNPHWRIRPPNFFTAYYKGTYLTVTSLTMMTPGAEFCGVTLYNV